MDRGEPRDQVRVLLLEHKKIEAIKLVREHTGWKLKRSKEYVDQVGRAMQS